MLQVIPSADDEAEVDDPAVAAIFSLSLFPASVINEDSEGGPGLPSLSDPSPPKVATRLA